MIEMMLEEKDKWWIVGFIESKGVFTKNKIKIRQKTEKGDKKYEYTNPAFYLVSKDISALEIMSELLGLGQIKKHGPISHLEVRRKGETIRLAEFLKDNFKSEIRRQQFERWRQMVLQWKGRGRG
ncbi:MAG: hypothetical protein AB1476_02320 [Candidatus Hadarchaeota archaeon]